MENIPAKWKGLSSIHNTGHRRRFKNARNFIYLGRAQFPWRGRRVETEEISTSCGSILPQMKHGHGLDDEEMLYYLLPRGCFLRKGRFNIQEVRPVRPVIQLLRKVFDHSRCLNCH